MKINKKRNIGFTLVELLSVIVVITIIFTIAIPALLDIIENVRKEAFRSTSYSIVDAGKYYYMHAKQPQSFYYFDSIELNANNERLEYDGQRPESGIVVLDNNGKVTLALHNGVYCATKPSNSDEVSISKTLMNDCSTYRIINTCDTWEQIAIKYDISLESLLDLNNETDSASSTCDRDIKIPVSSGSIESEYVFNNESGNLTYYKTYYTIGYINYSDPFSSTNYEYTIDLGNLPIPIEDVKTVKSTSSNVIEDLTDFEKYIVKKNIGEVIWPGEIPQQLDISQASEFKDHSTTSTNMTPDPVTVTCNATKCSATVGATIDNLTNVTPNTIDSNTIVYTPIKFTVEFNGVPDTQVADVCAITSVTDTTPGVLAGTGTLADPYLIESIEDLVVLSNNVNAGTTYSGKYLSLTTSLDFKDTKSYVNSSTTTYGDINGNGTVESLLTELTTGNGFLPIGSSSKSFSGILNGNIKCINNLYINRPSTSYVGLIGRIYNGTITAVTLNDVNIKGLDNSGSIVGYNDRGSVTESQITGSITGNNYTGLAVGYSYYDAISSVIVDGNVQGVDYVGGISGYCYASTLRGINKGGSITGTGTYVGRISGRNNSGTIRSLSLNTVTVKGSTVTNNDILSNNGQDIDNLTDLNDINLVELALDTYIGGDNDNNGYYWDYDTSGNVVRKNITDNPLTFNLTGSGTTASPYLINNYDELKQASLKPTSVFKLNADIDLTGKKFYMLGSFQNKFLGTFYGNFKTIGNLTINSPHCSYVGFTGYNRGLITALELDNLNITANRYVGGVAGLNIYDSSTPNSKAIISEVQVNGSITSDSYVGLATGYADSGKVNGVTVQGVVQGTNYIGGITGYIYSATIRGFNAGANVVATGASVGRTIGSNYAGTSYSLSIKTSKINGSTLTSTSVTNNNGQDINNITELDNINLAEIAFDTYIGGDNDGDGYYRDYDTNGQIVVKSVSEYPLVFNLTGSGTTASPYLINNYDELKQATLKPGSVFKLNADIDLSDKDFYVLGSIQNPFTGTFNGNLKTIRNLTINCPSCSYTGFIGFNYGMVTLLNLNDVNITANYYIGGIVGYNYYSSSYGIYSGYVTESEVTGSVTGNTKVGLAVGYSTIGCISGVVVQGNVQGIDRVGGILGESGDTILRGVNKGGTVTTTGGTAVGRIVGDYVNAYHRALSINTVTVNGSTVTSTDITSRNGQDISSMSDINNINLAELVFDTYIGGDNDGNGYYWDYDTNGNIVRKNITDYPLTFNLTGSGTTASPYLINTYDELKQASMKPTSVFKLNANIDLIGKQFYMLGSYQNQFTGTFNGNNKTISNLSINCPICSYVGFIGYNKGKITTLNLNNINITANRYVGGIAGFTTDIGASGASIYESQVTGSIIGNSSLGLITGYAEDGVISSVMSDGNVQGSSNVGGLVGYNVFTDIRGIYKGGSIIATSSTVGRIIGYDYGDDGYGLAINSTTINGSTVVSNNAFSENGQDISSMSELNNINLAEIALDTYIGGDNDANGYYWDYDTNGQMIRKSVSEYPLTFNLTGSGTTANPYLINNYDELKQASSKLGSVFKLNADIDLSGKEFYMLGSYSNPFTGTFNGGARTISNLTINSPHGSYVGFTAYNKGTIIGLNLNNVNITANEYVGGFAGYNSSGNIKDSIVSGSIVGSNYVGLVTGSSLYGNIKSVIVEGNVRGSNYVGGILGDSNRANLNCIHKGGVITSTGTYVGRISGYIYLGTLNSLALNTITVNGSTITSTLATSKDGKDITTSDLALSTTYTNIGFNFTDEVLDYIWYIDTGIAKFREGTL